MAPSAAGVAPGPETPGFRRVPRTGVIYVMHRAAAAGHGRDGRTWYNLGQGSPEVGPLVGRTASRAGLRQEDGYGPRLPRRASLAEPAD